MTKRAFTVNTGLVPGDSTANLGATSNKFDELHLSGTANVDGDLTVSGTITGTLAGDGNGLSDSTAIAYAIALG
jgi:cytoskeletal protein CcmA (bactofilin family)